VVAGERSGRPWTGVLFDERVDDHPDPLAELRRLVSLRRAFSLVGAVLFEEGPLFQRPEDVDPAHLARLLEDLERAQTLTADNGEPTLWRGILLARSGRVAEAATVLAPLLANRPPLAGFLHGLGEIGMLPPGVAGQLAPGGEAAR
jgi:hypothetical protein